MRVFLVVAAIVAGLYGFTLIPELFFTFVDPKATVLQQISARLGIGLALLVMVISLGLNAVIHELQRAIERPKAEPTPLVPSAPVDYSPPPAPPANPASFPQQPIPAKSRALFRD